MTPLTALRLVRQARHAAHDLRARGRHFPLAEAFYVDGPTRELIEALVGLGILQRADLDNVPERGPIVSAA